MATPIIVIESDDIKLRIFLDLSTFSSCVAPRPDLCLVTVNVRNIVNNWLNVDLLILKT